jgi:selenide,water dikinase
MTQDPKEVRLTQFSKFAGCGAKLGPALLDKALCGLQQPAYPNLISDFSHAEDCGVYRLTDEIALVQTIDFFPPVCDDPWTFGRIAAANALSDIYAMGATPVSAVSVVCFPEEQLDIMYLRKIMEGALDALIEAGAPLVGGHTVRDHEVKFGLSVNGTIHPDQVLENHGWHADEVLILTKPIGTMIINTASRAGMATEIQEQQALQSMMGLNRQAAEVLRTFPVSACTDVTGFGLFGHLCEMAQDSDIGVRIDVSAIPIISGTVDHASMGLIPAGAYTNIAFRSPCIGKLELLDDTMRHVFFSPETSGGLLFTVPQQEADAVIQSLKEHEIMASIIGYTTEEPGITLNVNS